MARWQLALILALVGVSLSAHAAVPTPQAIAAQARALTPALVECRRDIHMHPELSNREVRTGHLVAERLRKLGLEVREHVAGNGVVATLRGGKPGPTIAVRADIDALPIEEAGNAPYRSQNPGVKHACGHDVHTTIALGVAEILSTMKARLPGQVRFLFQPAEEGAPTGERGGAAVMIEQGALEPPPAAIIGLHVWPKLEVGQIGIRANGTMASADKFAITLIGKKSHGAVPQNGVDAVVVAAEAVTALQTIRSRRTDPSEPLVLTIGRINGGSRWNIIGDEVRLEGTVRTLDENVRKRVHEMMRQILDGVTSAQGATYKLEIEEAAPLTFNEPALTARVRRSLERAIGAKNVIEIPKLLVAEDFGYYQRKIPGVYFFLGVANAKKGITAMVHTAEFDVDEAAIPIGVTAMTEAVLGELGAR